MVIISVQPMFVLILAAVLLGDRVRPAHLVVCVFGAGGVVLLVFPGAAALAAVACMAAVSRSTPPCTLGATGQHHRQQRLASLGAALSFAIWFRGIGQLPARAVSVLALVSPMVATLLGYVFLHQALSVPQFAGILVIIFAALLAQSGHAEGKHGYAE